MAFSTTAQMMAAVEDWALEENGSVVKIKNSGLAIDVDRVRVYFSPSEGGRLWLECWSMVLLGVEKSPAMAKELLLGEDYSNYYAGTWGMTAVADSNEQLFNLTYGLMLLGEHLDKNEWLAAARLINHVAGTHSDELQAKWGGKTSFQSRFDL